MDASTADSRARQLLHDALEAFPPRLDRAALAVATLEHPELMLHPYEQQLDALAERVKAQKAGPHDMLAQLQALQRVLGLEENFRGNVLDYGAPENSFLNRVLETRLGQPITLSVMYLEVARRAGIPLFGVAFPGHFMVACAAPSGGKLVMDPFHGGEILTEAGCEDTLKRVVPQMRFSPRMLTPAPVKTVASRILTNLKRTYLARGDGERALKVLDLLLSLNPNHPGDLRARASIFSTLGAYRAALADVEKCLELSPMAPDHVHLRLAAHALRERVDFLN